MRRREGDEFYRIFGQAVNVTSLREWAEANGLPVVRVDVQSIARLCAFDAKPGEMGVFFFDPEHAKKLPAEALKVPGILLRVRGSVILVDGTHRAYRLWRLGRATMPMYCIEDQGVIQEHSTFPASLWGRGDAQEGKVA